MKGDPQSMLPPRKHFRHIKDLPQLSRWEKWKLHPVEREFAFRANDYYLRLIDWKDANDPLRKLVIPQVGELGDRGELDPSRERDYTVLPGMQHKYPKTALLLLAETCDSYCRYCFRKRLTLRRSEEIARDTREALEYIRTTKAISNVLLTGGDPLTLATSKLASTIRELMEIEHVRIVRIGSKIPAFNPFRILEDPQLLTLFDEFRRSCKRVYLMAHFTHPRELTQPALDAIQMCLDHGVIVTNQCPLVRGINDDEEVLAELFSRLTAAGAPPYYLFIGRPTRGNALFEVPVVRAWQLHQMAMSRVSGLARRARLVMSHHLGKIEVAAVTENRIILRYHRAARHEDNGRVLICRRRDDAIWLDDLEVVESASLGRTLHKEHAVKQHPSRHDQPQGSNQAIKPATPRFHSARQSLFGQGD